MVGVRVSFRPTSRNSTRVSWIVPAGGPDTCGVAVVAEGGGGGESGKGRRSPMRIRAFCRSRTRTVGLASVVVSARFFKILSVTAGLGRLKVEAPNWFET